MGISRIYPGQADGRIERQRWESVPGRGDSLREGPVIYPEAEAAWGLGIERESRRALER